MTPLEVRELVELCVQKLRVMIYDMVHKTLNVLHVLLHESALFVGATEVFCVVLSEQCMASQMCCESSSTFRILPADWTNDRVACP